MATASTTSTRPVPELPRSSDTLPTILDEVRAAQEHLRTRLAGALTIPPPKVAATLLPTVPLIDLAPSFSGSRESMRAVASEIHDACLTTGFFQISNHSIPTTAADGILTQAARFFHDLTPDQKDALHIKHSSLYRGYEPPGSTYVNPDDDPCHSIEASSSSSAETKEGFNWGYEPALDPTGGDGKYVELDGTPPEPGHTNVWPSETDLPGFQAGVAEYYSHVLRLARHLCRLFALSLELEETYFDPLTTHPGGIGRLLYYPSQPAAPTDSKDPNEGKLGLGAHTDYECFTLLLSSANPGLEILFPPSPLTDDRPLWQPCPVRPDTLTVNVADFLMRWTNGLYKSTVHRVVSRPGAGERYSVPFFFSINYDADVAPLPERAVGKGAGFRTMRAGEYVLERLRATDSLAEVGA